MPHCLVSLVAFAAGAVSLFLTNFWCVFSHLGLRSLLGVRFEAPPSHGFSFQLCHCLSCVTMVHFFPRPVSSELPHLFCHQTKFESSSIPFPRWSCIPVFPWGLEQLPHLDTSFYLGSGSAGANPGSSPRLLHVLKVIPRSRSWCPYSANP